MLKKISVVGAVVVFLICMLVVNQSMAGNVGLTPEGQVPGKPFEVLQQQIDRLKGQACPTGEFVTGFDQNGDIVCSGDVAPSDPDADSDGFLASQDCNDNDNTIYPGAPEVCNGVDDSCDGDVDEGCTMCTPGDSQVCYSGPAGTQGVGICLSGYQVCNADGSSWGGCEGEITPVVEVCSDLLDNNCDGSVDEPVCL